MQEQNEILTNNFMAGQTNSCQQNHDSDCFLDKQTGLLTFIYSLTQTSMELFAFGLFVIRWHFYLLFIISVKWLSSSLSAQFIFFDPARHPIKFDKDTGPIVNYTLTGLSSWLRGCLRAYKYTGQPLKVVYKGGEYGYYQMHWKSMIKYVHSLSIYKKCHLNSSLI